MSLGADTIYNIVTAAIAFSLLIANFVLSLVSLFKCRRQGDPARQGLRWMKLSGALLNVYFVCNIITCILSALYDEMGYYVRNDRQPFVRARACFDALSRFFVELTCAALFITFVSLGFGILYTRASAPETKGSPQPRLLATKVTAGVLAALAVALLGLSIDLQESVMVRFNSSDPPNEDIFEVYNRKGLIVQRLSGTLTLLFFIVSVVTLGYSFYVVVSASKIHGHSKKPAILLIVAVTLYLERNLYRVIIMGLFYNFTNDTLSAPQYLPVLTIIFEAVPLVLLLILLSSLAQLKRGGLWSAGSENNPQAQQQYPPYHQQALHRGTNGTLPLGQQPVQIGWTYQQNAQHYVGSGTGM